MRLGLIVDISCSPRSRLRRRDDDGRRRLPGSVEEVDDPADDRRGHAGAEAALLHHRHDHVLREERIVLSGLVIAANHDVSCLGLRSAVPVLPITGQPV